MTFSKVKYVYCLNHPKTRAINAKELCAVCTKERHEKSAKSKGFTVKKKEDGHYYKREILQRKGDSDLQTLQNDKIGHTGDRDNGSFATHKECKKNKIKPISKNKALEVAVLAKIKSNKIRELGKKCEMCSKHGEVDLFHIIGVGDKNFATNETNLLLSCRFCHLIWGANDFDKIQRFINYQEILNRLKSLDEGKYWKFIHRVEKFNND